MKKSLFTKVDCIRVPVPTLQEGLQFYSGTSDHKILWKTPSVIGLGFVKDITELVLYIIGSEMEIDFKVENIDNAIKIFEEAGGTTVIGPFDIPIGKCVVVKDPWENQFLLLDSSKGPFETDADKNVIGVHKGSL